MSERRHIVSTFNKRTVGHKYRREIIMVNNSKEVQVKLMKGLLDMVVLQFLNSQPMHGYQIITKIRKTFGVYFGPSTIYPLLNALEKKGHVKSEWNMNSERPRKVYKLTSEGQNLLNFTEDSLNFICRKIGNSGMPPEDLTQEHALQPALRPFLKKIEHSKPMI